MSDFSKFKSKGAYIKEAIQLFSYFIKTNPKSWYKIILILIFTGFIENFSIFLLLPILSFLSQNTHGTSVDIDTGIFAKFLGPQIVTDIIVVLAVYVLIIIISSYLTRVRSLLMGDMMHNSINTIRINLFNSLAMAKWSFLNTIRVPDMEHAINGDVDRVQIAIFTSLVVFQSAFFLGVYTLISFTLSFEMTLFAIITGILIFLIQRPIRKFSAEYGSRFSSNSREQYRTINEFLSGIKITKSFGAEDKYINQFISNLNATKKEILKFTEVSSIGTMVSSVLTSIVACVFLYVSSIYFQLPFSKILILMIVFMRITPRFSDLQNNLQAMIVALPAFKSILSFTEKAEAQRETLLENNAAPITFQKEISLKGLSFKYGDEYALKGINLSIPKNKCTAIIGASGSGKTTLIDNLMGLLWPETGAIHLDNEVLDPQNIKSWRKRIGYVPQENYLMATSLKDNIKLGKPEATDEEVIEALKLAEAYNFVEKLPNGIETIIGDGAIKFSGGERQRLAIARSLIRKPELLILDEFTSALDKENTINLIQTIKSLKSHTTILIITHNHDLLEIADFVHEMKDGYLVK